MRIAESFYSVQGEGVTAGVPAVFLRFAGCNLMCGGPNGSLVAEGKATWWCDTEAVWRSGRETTPEEWWNSLAPFVREGLVDGSIHLVVTGGEPLLPENWEAFVALLEWVWLHYSFLKTIEIETNGTVFPSRSDISSLHLSQLNVSPKLANSGMPRAIRLVPSVLKVLQDLPDVWFKFVVSRPEDAQEIIADWYPHLDDRHRRRIILMPACSRREEVAEATRMAAEVAKEFGWRVCTRLQVLAWDRTTGV